MANETMKMAAEIVKNPKLLDQYAGQYLVIMDQAATYPKFDNLAQAICIMAEQGWKAISTSVIAPTTIGFNVTIMYILMEKQKPNQNDDVRRLADAVNRLEQHIRSWQPDPDPAPTPPLQSTRICRKCNSPMVIRSATSGENKGKKFYVCSAYPNCDEVIAV